MILLASLRAEIRAASWFAALGEELTPGDLADARAYAETLGLGDLLIYRVRDWPEAERTMKAPDWSVAWWDREEAERKRLLAAAEGRFPERALWTALTELTTEAGELVHGKAATAASRAGGVAAASMHVAAGAASQAVYQLAAARFAGPSYRILTRGRWPGARGAMIDGSAETSSTSGGSRSTSSSLNELITRLSSRRTSRRR